MSRVIGAFVLAGGAFTLGVLAFPPAAALPAVPAAGCLPTGPCLPEPAPDPCTPVNGVDPCAPVDIPAVPPDAPNVPDVPDVPVPSDAPGVPGNAASDPVAVDVPGVPAPAPTPRTAVPSEVGSSGDARPDSRLGGGGVGPRSEAIPPPSLTGAAAVADTTRSFAPLFVLAALVGGYLLVQGRLDRRDPKLSAAPLLRDDEIVSFG